MLFQRAQRAVLLLLALVGCEGGSHDDVITLGHLFPLLDNDADGQLSRTELSERLLAEHGRLRQGIRKRKHAEAHQEYERTQRRCGEACAGGFALEHVRRWVHLPDMHAVRGGASEERARRFRLADGDADGVLDADELFALLHPAHALPHEEHTRGALELHLKRLDVDEDGRVDFEEHYADQRVHARHGEGEGPGEDVVAAVTAVVGGAGLPARGAHPEHRARAGELREREHARFQRHDLDADGKLDGAELRRLLFPVHDHTDVVAKEVAHLMLVADEDRDGKLSLLEAQAQASRLLRFLHQRAERVHASIRQDEL